MKSGPTDVLSDDDDEPPSKNEEQDEYVPESPNQDDPAPDPILEVHLNLRWNHLVPQIDTFNTHRRSNVVMMSSAQGTTISAMHPTFAP